MMIITILIIIFIIIIIIFSCSYKLSNADVQAFMRLDNALFGELDTDKLGY